MPVKFTIVDVSAIESIMKQTLKTSAMALALGLALSGCGGGGGDEAGSPMEFSTVPDAWELKGPNDVSCGAGQVDVKVIGGAAPYTLTNLVPGYVTIDKIEVDKNGTFTVTFLGACMDGGLIDVRDALDNHVQVELSNVKGDAP